ncbi:DUF4226 domain-containing protein [Mycolicibacter arupensis]|nr:DUF4226 domain-containing protein [Mycolicibacter arupensis]
MAENVGAFADAARAREEALATRLAASAAADTEFQAMLQQVVRANTGSRQRLNAIEAEIRESAATWPGLDTPAGSRQFQRFLTAKTREIHHVVSAAAGDDERRAHLAQALTNHYRLGSGQDGDPHIRLVDNTIAADGQQPRDPTINGVAARRCRRSRTALPTTWARRSRAPASSSPATRKPATPDCASPDSPTWTTRSPSMTVSARCRPGPPSAPTDSATRSTACGPTGRAPRRTTTSHRNRGYRTWPTRPLTWGHCWAPPWAQTPRWASRRPAASTTPHREP